MDEKRRNRNRNLRTIFVVVSMANQFFCSVASVTDFIGNSTFSVVYNIVSLALTGVSSALAWWYNNSFTEEAKASDEYMYELKKYNKEKEEIRDENNVIYEIDEEGE